MSNKEMNVIHGVAGYMEAVCVNRMANNPMVVESPPGMGKTQLGQTLVGEHAAQFVPLGWDPAKVAETGTKIVQVRVGRHEEYDFPGIPWAKDDGMTIHLHPILRSLSYGDVLILDEYKLKGANKMAMQMMEGDRPTCGDWVGPEHVFRLALANGTDDGALECVENPVLGNRTSQYRWTGPTSGEFVVHALEKKANPILITGVKMEGDNLLKDYNPSRMRNTTPRSIMEASENMDALERYCALQGREPTHEQRLVVLASWMHDAAAVRFAALFHLRDKLIPFATIVSSPNTAPVPDSPAAMMMLCSNVGNKTNTDNFTPVMQYVTRLPVEVQGAIVDPVLKRHPELAADKLTQDYLLRTSSLRRSF
jgi:hypothetical protein